MLFKMNKVSLAVLVFLGFASNVMAQYQNDGPEIRYEPTSDNTRSARISSATAIQGCDAGLIVVSGVYTCRSNALVSQGGTVPDPIVVYSGGGGHHVSGPSNAWGLPGWTGGYAPGYDANGRTDPTSLGSEGPGTPTSSNGGGGGGSSRVICTHFFAKGEIPKNVWRADLAFTKANLSEATVRGYHAWAIGYVKLMRKSKLAEDIMRPIALHRAQELAYQMGVVEKGSWRGKLARLALEPLCFAIGKCVGARDYMALWKDQPLVLKVLGEAA